ncbi:MAG: hypothetical protein ACUVTO_06840 [Candidatus Caldatribacteriaceae bacterium]
MGFSRLGGNLRPEGWGQGPAGKLLAPAKLSSCWTAHRSTWYYQDNTFFDNYNEDGATEGRHVYFYD